MYTLQLTINCFQNTPAYSSSEYASARVRFKGNGPNAQSVSLLIALSHNTTELHAQRQPSPSFPGWEASRAEQLAEQSAELSTAVVPCRTWPGPFPQHDSAGQNGAILKPGPLDYKSRRKQKNKVSRIRIQRKTINVGDWQGLKVERKLTPTHDIKANTWNVTSNSDGHRGQGGGGG